MVPACYIRGPPLTKPEPQQVRSETHRQYGPSNMAVETVTVTLQWNKDAEMFSANLDKQSKLGPIITSLLNTNITFKLDLNYTLLLWLRCFCNSLLCVKRVLPPNEA